MQCHFCLKDHVDKIFYISSGDALYQLPICNECLQKRWQLAVATGIADVFQRNTGWCPGQPDARHLGEQSFPEAASENLRAERKLKALNYRLEEATKSEHYEEAAKLRDDIAAMKEKGCHCGN